MKRPRPTKVALALIICTALVQGCKDGTSPPPARHNLSVYLAPGVTGTPSEGATTHPDTAIVAYEFAPAANYQGLIVTLDGTPVATSGTVRMISDRVLAATADLTILIPQRDSALLVSAQQILTASGVGAAYEAHLKEVTELYESVGADEARGRLTAVYAHAFDPVGDSSAIRKAIVALGSRVFAARGAVNSATRSGGLHNWSEDSAATTTIIYVNGVLTWPTEPAMTEAELNTLVINADLTGVEVKHFYNATTTQSEDFNLAVCVIGSVSEALAFNALLGQFTPVIGWLGWVKLLADCSPLGDFVQAGNQLLNVLSGFPDAADPEAQALALLVQQELILGRTVVLVLHSQGNLMGQEALNHLMSSVQDRCIGVVSLAAPTTIGWPVGGEAFGAVVVEEDIILSLGLNLFSQLSTVLSRAADEFVQDASNFIARGLADLFTSVYLHSINESYFNVVGAHQQIESLLRIQVEVLQQRAGCGGAVPRIFAESGSGSVLISTPPSDLYSVEAVAEGHDALIGRVQTAAGFEPVISDLALAPDRKLWGTSFEKLYQISTLTAEAVEVGSLNATGVNALAFDSNGNLFGATRPLFGSGSLLQINTETGNATVIGSLGSGFSSWGDIAFAPDGTVFATVRTASGVGLLVTVDTTTGQATPVNPDTPIGFDNVWGLTFVGNELFGLTTDAIGLGTLITIDISEGTGSFVRDLSFNAGGAAAPRQ